MQRWPAVFVEILRDASQGRIYHGVKIYRGRRGAWRTQKKLWQIGLSIHSDSKGTRAYLAGDKFFYALPKLKLWENLYG